MHFSLTDGNVYRLHADKFHKPGHDRIMKLFTFFFFFGLPFWVLVDPLFFF